MGGAESKQPFTSGQQKNECWTKYVVTGIIIIGLIILVVYFAGGFSSGGGGGGGGGGDQSKVIKNVTKLVDDWETLCPIEKEIIGDIYVEYPRCDVATGFSLNNYDNNTVIAFQMAFNGTRYETPNSMDWPNVKDEILGRVTGYLK